MSLNAHYSEVCGPYGISYKIDDHLTLCRCQKRRALQSFICSWTASVMQPGLRICSTPENMTPVRHAWTPELVLANTHEIIPWRRGIAENRRTLMSNERLPKRYRDTSISFEESQVPAKYLRRTCMCVSLFSELKTNISHSMSVGDRWTLTSISS